ncbi:MAG: J domain-containing protein [Polyangiales bacterium]
MADRLDDLDYYTLLGLEPHATADAVRDAFHRFALKYHPDNHSGGDPTRLARATQIFRRGAEAYRVLSSPDSRRRYDEGLAKGDLRLAAEPEAAARQAGTRRRSTARRTLLPQGGQLLASGDLMNAKLSSRSRSVTTRERALAEQARARRRTDRRAQALRPRRRRHERRGVVRSWPSVVRDVPRSSRGAASVVREAPRARCARRRARVPRA